MKSILVTFTVASLSLLNVGLSQTPSGSRTAQEQQVLDRALDFWHNVFLPLKVDKWPDYVAADYVEHYPGATTPALDWMLGYFRPIMKDLPNGLPRVEPVLSMVDGDITLLVVPGDKNDGKEPLRPELQRWKDGKQVEHWDGEAANAPPTKPQVNGRLAAEQRNLDLVVNFWHDVLGPLKTAEFGKYFAANFIEHDAAMPQGGLPAMQRAIGNQRAQNPKEVPRKTFVHALVDGELVALLHVKDGGPDPQAPSKRKQILGLDVVRVVNGKMVEHWADARFIKAPMRIDRRTASGIDLPAAPSFVPGRLMSIATEYDGEQMSVRVMQSSSTDPSVSTCLNMVNFPSDAVVSVLNGRLVLTEAKGQPQEFVAGDVAVLPKGFTGTWQDFGTYRHVIVMGRGAVPQLSPCAKK